MKEFEWEYDQITKQLTLNTRIDIFEKASENLIREVRTSQAGIFETVHHISIVDGVFSMNIYGKYQIILSVAPLFDNKTDIARIKQEVEQLLDLDNNRNLIITDAGVKKL